MIKLDCEGIDCTYADVGYLLTLKCYIASKSGFVKRFLRSVGSARSVIRDSC